MNFSLYVLLQGDQSTPWSSMEDKTEGTHISPEYRTTTSIREKTHSNKMMREASTHGTITLPNHEH